MGGLCLLVASLVVPRSAPAEDPGAILRWADVVASVDRHPLVQEARAQAEGAAGAVTEARELPNPVFGVSGGDAWARGGTAHRREWSYSVELPLEFLNARRQRVAAARGSEVAAREDGRAVRAGVLRELRRDFVAVVHAGAAVEARVELEEQVARLAALVRKRAERGEGRPIEVTRIETELERLRTTLGRARSGLEARRQRLAAWLGAPVNRVEADLARTLTLEPLDALLRRVLEDGPALGAGRARVAAAEREASAERWERLPRLAAGAEHTEELDRRATTLSATVTFPLWNWNAGRIRQADAALAGARARLDGATRELSAALSESWQGCAAGQAAAARFRDEVLPRAESSARTLGRAFELGESGLLDVIDARRVLLDTRSEYLDLLLDMQNACGDLAALAGLELP